MKQLVDLELSEILNYVVNNADLNSKFKDYIVETEFMWIDDKMRCFYNCIDYSYGVFGDNYMNVTNEYDFLNGVEKSIRCFGCSEKLQKLFNQTKKLYGTNLFSYHCEKLCELYFEDEIQRIIDFLEDMSMELDSNVISEKFKNTYEDYIDCFISNGYLDKYYINDNNELFKNYNYGR